jgi:O-antigen/teichoic acid export membrane protein
MRFADYFKQTIWAVLDKTLPVIYGFGFIFVVVRVLPEKEFGLLTLFQGIFYFVVMLDTALVQMPMAKFVAEGNDSGWAIASGLLLSFAVLAICSLICTMGAPVFAIWLKAPELAAILWYLPLLLTALYFKNLSCQICVGRHETTKLFIIDAIYFLGSLGLLAVWQNTGKLTDAVAVILINIYAAALASLAGAALQYRALRAALRRVRLKHLQRIFDFGKYALGGGLASYLYSQADTYMISFFYHPAQVGVYSAGKIIYRLYNVIAQAAQVVILPLASRFAAAEQREELRALLEKAVCFFYFMLVPLNVILLFGAEAIFSLLYAGRYTEAVGVFRWLVIGTFFMAWGTVGNNLLLGMGQARLSFQVTWLVTIANIVLNLILIPKLNILGAALANAITMGLSAALMFFYLKRHLGFSVRKVWQRRRDALEFARALWLKISTG